MEQNKPIEIEYEKPSLWRRFCAYFLDLLVLVGTTILLFTATNAIYQNSSKANSLKENLTQIKNNSGLYVNDVLITDYVSEDSSFESTSSKVNFISNAINSFYINLEFFSNEESSNLLEEYKQRKLNYLYNDQIRLFELDGQNVVEKSVNPEYLYTFYEAELENYSLFYLNKNSDYSSITKTQFITEIIFIIVDVFVAFTLLYVLIPLLIFKRGRQTLFMKVFKISLIDVTASTVSTSRYIFRSLFNLFINIYLAFFSFLVPIFISIGMIFFSKSNSSLTNYLFNDYYVDTTNKTIYLSPEERYLETEKINNISIENNDLRLK